MPKKADIPSKWTWYNTLVVIIFLLFTLLGLDLPPFHIKIPINTQAEGQLFTENNELIETVDVTICGEISYHLLSGARYDGDLTIQGDTLYGDQPISMDGRYDGFLQFRARRIFYNIKRFLYQPKWGDYAIDSISYDLMMKHVEIIAYSETYPIAILIIQS